MFTDESLMPFGVHKGKQLQDVPAHYLLWFKENQSYTGNQDRANLLKYIEENEDVLKEEVKRQAQQEGRTNDNS